MKKIILPISLLLACPSLMLAQAKKDLQATYEANIQAKQAEFKQAKELGQTPPNKYFEQKYLQSMDPTTGELNTENLLNYFNNSSQFAPKNDLDIIGKTSKSARSSKSAKSGTVLDKMWDEIGPNYVGGRTRAIAFDPNDANGKRVFAGSVSGGLWVNEDASDETSPWKMVDGLMPNMSISSIAFDPNNPQVVYLGTGEVQTGDTAGQGVFKSTDGGKTWKQIFTMTTSYSGNLKAGNFYVNDIKVRNNNGVSEVYLAVGGRYYYPPRNSSGHFLGLRQAGLYKSTDGENFSRINTGAVNVHANLGVAIEQIEIAADNSIWATSRTSVFTDIINAGKIFKSTDGVNFTTIFDVKSNKDYHRTKMALSKTDANKAYAIVTYPNPNDAEEILRLIKTTDGGKTWVSTLDKDGEGKALLNLPNPVDVDIPDADFTRGQNWYDLVLAVDPDNDERVLVGGIDLYQTTDGAKNWQQIAKWSNNNEMAKLVAPVVHADQHAILFNPKNPKQVIFGNDGGIFFASDKSAIGASASSITARNYNYNVTQFYDISINPTGSDNYEEMLAGAQDNGTQMLSGAKGYNQYYQSKEFSGGDGMLSDYGKNNAFMVYSYTFNNLYFNEYQKSWSNVFTSAQVSWDDQDSTGNFVNSFCLDKNKSILYSYAKNLPNPAVTGQFMIQMYRTTLPTRTNFLKMDVKHASIRSGEYANYTTTSPNNNNIANDPNNTSTLFIGTNRGRIIKVARADTATPVVTVLNTNMLTAPVGGTMAQMLGTVSNIQIGTNDNEIYATFSNYNTVSVWYTNDGGVTWQSKEGNLPDVPVLCLFVNPDNREEVLVGTDSGVFGTANFSTPAPQWANYSYNIGAVPVTSFDYRVSDKKLVVSTYGRGAFQTKVNDDTKTSYQNTPKPINVYPNPSKGLFRLDYNEFTYPQGLDVQIFDRLGRLVFEKSGLKKAEEIITNLGKGEYTLVSKNANETVQTSNVLVR